MTDDHHIPYGRVPAPERPEGDVDVLLGRLVDGEATPSDRARFDVAASREPRLWRELALRHQDMMQLREAYESEVDAAVELELPVGRPAARRSSAGRWALAVSGWAAMLLVGLGWIMTTTSRPLASPPGGIPAAGDQVAASPAPSPDESFAHYLTAPNVLGELEPLVLEIRELDDGRVAVRYVRRVEEVAYIPSPEALPVTEDGRLSVSPADLRDAAPQSGPN